VVSAELDVWASSALDRYEMMAVASASRGVNTHPPNLSQP